MIIDISSSHASDLHSIACVLVNRRHRDDSFGGTIPEAETLTERSILITQFESTTHTLLQLHDFDLI